MAEKMAVAKDALAVEFGKRGARARMTKMTAEERRRVAKRAAQARWGKKADAPNPDGPKGPNRDERRGPGIMLSARRRPASASSDHLSGRSRAAAA